MSSQVWKEVYRIIRLVNRSIPREGRRPQFPDTLILAMYVWSVAHDRPLVWAAERSNYTSVFRPRRLPSRSQFCRRLKSKRCGALLDAVYARLASTDDPDALRIVLMDGRGLPVPLHSTDPDTAIGWAAGGLARGYKLHALAGENGRFKAIRITAMNVAEPKVAEELLEAEPPAVVLADQGYESSALYDAAAARRQILMTPLRRNAGKGHRPQSRARMFAKKLWSLGGEVLYRRRLAIERFFGQLSVFGGGLGPLPTWVRRLERVERWVTAKITLYHARLTVREAEN